MKAAETDDVAGGRLSFLRCSPNAPLKAAQDIAGGAGAADGGAGAGAADGGAGAADGGGAGAADGGGGSEDARRCEILEKKPMSRSLAPSMLHELT